MRIFHRVLITGIKGSGASYMAEYIVTSNPFYRSSWYCTVVSFPVK